MLFGACWTPRSSNIDDARGGRDPPRRRAHQLRVDAAALGVVGDRRRRRAARSTGSAPRVCASRNSSSMRSSWTITASSAARHQASVPGRDPQVEVGHLRGLGADRVDDDHRALRILARSRAGPRARAGSSATATGSCRRTPPPRRARSRRACGRRRDGRRPRTRRSSPARARSSGSASRARAGTPRCRRRRGGCPARRRRNRRSSRRRRSSRTAAKRAAISAIAVSQSISSKLPSGRRRSGEVSRSRPFW